MKLALVGRAVMLALSLAGLANSFILANLLGEVGRSDGLIQYPNSERLSATSFTLDIRGKGYVSQSGSYRSPDNTAQVFSWYAHRYGLSQNETLNGMGPCQTLTETSERFHVRYALAVTLCSVPGGTLIMVNRGLGVR